LGRKKVGTGVSRCFCIKNPPGRTNQSNDTVSDEHCDRKCCKERSNRGQHWTEASRVHRRSRIYSAVRPPHTHTHHPPKEDQLSGHSRDEYEIPWALTPFGTSRSIAKVAHGS